jgi:hypothetical protein
LAQSMNERAKTNDALFDEVCAMLQAGHLKKPHHTPLDTINRLFSKYVKGKPSQLSANPPWLTSRNTVVTRETRSKQEFAKLAHPEGEARDSDHSIVIVRYRNVDCLLDGNHRGRAWLESGDAKPHTAYVLIVHEQ